MDICKNCSTHPLYTTLKMINFLLAQITFKMAENKWAKICNFHTGRFSSGVSGAI